MTTIFKAKTHEGYCMKLLAELLKNNVKDACFEISKEGMNLRMMDTHRTVLIDIKLNSDNFIKYKYKHHEEKMFLGVNMTHFHKMLKTIKKKDSVEFYISNEDVKEDKTDKKGKKKGKKKNNIKRKDPEELAIKVIPKEKTRVSISFVQIYKMQNLDVDLPEGYGNPVIVPSSEFQKMCKELAQISPKTKVSSHGSKINFTADAGGVMKKSTELGDLEGDDSDDEEEVDDKYYNAEFNTEQFTRITKISGLSDTMQIFPHNNMPLWFRSPIGTIGTISIYIKSKELQEMEARAVENDDSEDE